MFRIDQPTAAGSIPVPAAAGTPGYFTNGNPANSTPSTVVDADWLNMIQEELVAVVLAAPGPPALSKTTRTQVRDAITALIAVGASAASIQAQAGNYAAAGGTANAITATYTPAVGSHIIGAPLRVKIGTNNSGATTFNPGAGVKTVVAADGSALVGGELIAGAIVEFKYDGTNYQFEIIKASTTQIGVSRFATTAETKAGALSSVGVTPAGLLGSVFESAEQTITAATDTGGIAHGLTAPCKRVQAWLRCKTAELGYAIGDEYLIVPNQDTGVHGIATYISGANLGFVVCLGGNVNIYRRNASIGDSIAITNGNWRVVLRAASF